ncbi:hypothetical protein TRM7615_03749 [Falsiruegeria mediterranea M17]|uniref:Uncharacterized protein n=2 Tax=Falsiruegeria TaxID=2854184 RepID=A0A2R8CCW6_9RHOB|nr:hypothetical protein TRM7615_03749 [Falsiruegeria mediterranea M17]
MIVLRQHLSMRQITHITAALVLIATPVWADICPQAPDHSENLAALITDIQTAETEREARIVSNKMWSYWADAPNEQAQAILDRGMSKRAAWDLLGAREDFDALITYCPNYAEGYNQRAFVHFLNHNFQAALVDLDQALALSPDHVAALSGRALSLLGLSRIDEARETLQTALELNPWLPERGLLDAGGALAPKGKDI